MSRNLFGWDLPPGVTSGMIDEQFGCSAEESLTETFYEQVNEAAHETVNRGNIGLDEVALEKLSSWFVDQMNEALSAGRRDAIADEKMAQEAIGLTDAIKQLAACPLLPHHDAAEDSRPLFGMDGWHLTVGMVRAARRSLPGQG